jgi:large subunit ribosomal protein L7A
MDTHKSTRRQVPDALSELQNRKVIVGAKQLKKALLSGIARRVFLAENADPALTQPIEAMCLEKQISCIWVPSMADLGYACGIDVGAAAAAVTE